MIVCSSSRAAASDEAGLVTSEMVPAFHAVAPERRVGELKLARLRF
jgi:hypothetical protein